MRTTGVGARLVAVLSAAMVAGALGVIAPARARAADMAAPTASADDGGRVVVGLVTPAASSAASASEAAAAVGGTVDTAVNATTYRIRVAPRRAADAAARLAHDPRVAWAEPDAVLHASVVPNDPCFSGCFGYDQWNLRAVGAPQAWAVTEGSSSVEVATLDTGVDASHPDLAGKVIVGPNFSGTSSDADVNGHGSHVAGIIAAVTDNGVGVSGLGWNTRVRSLKVLDDQGSGFSSDIAKGIYEAVSAGSRVINLSLAGDKDNKALKDAIASAIGAGVVVVAAAGNAGSDVPTYPSAYPGVLSVGATLKSGAMAAFSNYGSWVDVVAPGETIVSTIPGGYGIQSGTSMAAPLASATAALMIAAAPSLGGARIVEVINATTAPIAESGSKVRFGRLDTAHALSSAVVATGAGGKGTGYRLAARDGGIFSFGAAPFFGSTGSIALNRPIVGMAGTPSGRGYWMVASDGGIFSFGDAGFYGSTGGAPLAAPVVGMAASPTGQGYWLAAADGGVFAFGDARFHGAPASLARPIVGIAAAPSGAGYWLVASDGGIFAFGAAGFHGSTGAIRLNQPIVAMAASPSGSGYWLVARDGGIFAFGDAPFVGSTGGIALNKPIVGMASPAPDGYWLVASDGGIFSFGTASFFGSTGAITLNQPVVAMIA